MEKIKINNKEFSIVKNFKNALDKESIESYVTDYFMSYDYIVGDWSYGKLRLKGFFESKNKKCNDMNNINDLEEYIENYCAFGCAYFVLKK